MNNEIRNYIDNKDLSLSQNVTRIFFSRVYFFMFLGLLLTGIVSWAVSHNADAVQLLFVKSRIIFYLLIAAELGLVFWLSLKINTMSVNTARISFISYAIINGITLSFIFLVYTSGSITNAFFVSSATYAAMAVLGYVVKKDLSAFGQFLMVGLIGLIIASIINLFWHNSALDFAVSVIGVFIFAGLTAYDHQKLKNLSYSLEVGTPTFSKMVIIGALNLYLDFINLFLFLLRLFGDRR